MHFAAATHFLEPFQVTEKSCYDKLMGVMELDLLDAFVCQSGNWETWIYTVYCIDVAVIVVIYYAVQFCNDV